MTPGDPPSAWEMFRERLRIIEDKLDKLRENTVTRPEFLRTVETLQAINKDHEQEIESLKNRFADAELAEQKRLNTEAGKVKDEKAKFNLFIAGLILTPIISLILNWIVSGGLVGV